MDDEVYWESVMDGSRVVETVRDYEGFVIVYSCRIHAYMPDPCIHAGFMWFVDSLLTHLILIDAYNLNVRISVPRLNFL